MIDQLAAAATPTTCDEVWDLGQGLPGDLDRDCRVDLADFAAGACEICPACRRSSPTG